jgi:hypothetical protein
MYRTHSIDIILLEEYEGAYTAARFS